MHIHTSHTLLKAMSRDFGCLLLLQLLYFAPSRLQAQILTFDANTTAVEIGSGVQINVTYAVSAHQMPDIIWFIKPPQCGETASPCSAESVMMASGRTNLTLSRSLGTFEDSLGYASRWSNANMIMLRFANHRTEKQIFSFTMLAEGYVEFYVDAILDNGTMRTMQFQSATLRICSYRPPVPQTSVLNEGIMLPMPLFALESSYNSTLAIVCKISAFAPHANLSLLLEIDRELANGLFYYYYETLWLSGDPTAEITHDSTDRPATAPFCTPSKHLQKTTRSRFTPNITMNYRALLCRSEYLLPNGTSASRESRSPLSLIDLPETRIAQGVLFLATVTRNLEEARQDRKTIAFVGDTVYFVCRIRAGRGGDRPVVTRLNYTGVIEAAIGCAGVVLASNRTAGSGVTVLNSIIREVTLEESGIYACCIENRANGPRDYIQLDARQPKAPKLTGPSEEARSVSEGGSLELPCKAEAADPPASLLWLKDNTPFTKADGIREFSSAGNDATKSVYIDNADKRHEGVYSCVAANPFGSDSKRYKVSVSAKPTAAEAVAVLPLAVSLAVLGLLILIVLCAVAFMRFRRIRELRPLFEMIWQDLELASAARIGGQDDNACITYDRSLELQRLKDLSIMELLGIGNYSKVHLGRLDGANVAVKMPSDRLCVDQHMSIIAEIVIMSQLRGHPNVLGIVGASTKNVGHGTQYLITEHCKYGSLLHVLQLNRDATISGNREIIRDSATLIAGNQGEQNGLATLSRKIASLGRIVRRTCIRRKDEGVYVSPATKLNAKLSTSQLMHFGLNVAEGMDFLHSRNIIHRDLAARNILVAESLEAKISDFGLSKSADAYCATRSSRMPPIRWQAIESIADGVFTAQTDVWSYGVVLWEIFSMGCLPYEGIAEAMDIGEFLKAGKRLQKPYYSSGLIYRLMTACWDSEPTARPSFSQAATVFEDAVDANDRAEEDRPVATASHLAEDSQSADDRDAVVKLATRVPKKKSGYVKAGTTKVFDDNIPLSAL